VRVIAGSARGTRLAPVPRGTRPISDMAREGLFASLGSLVEDARWLDLFAGTGAAGIEALSRGADSAVFVDRSPEAVSAIRDNLGRTRLEASARVIRADVRRWLAEGPARQEPFDVVLLDPPYTLGSDQLGELLGALTAGWLAPEGWTVIVTRGHKSSLPAVPVHWAIRRQLRYGDSLLIQYREERWA
jgi:16S rRNA (guanine966-N2)-methyltransferase